MQAIFFPADKFVPNNPSLPFICYRGAIDVGGGDAEQVIVRHFARNGWVDAWVNGIYPFQHYHATAHEVLGIARGRALVQFGGPGGPRLEVTAGDVVLLPAGVGHCSLEMSNDLSVIGAYPEGQSADLRRNTAADHRGAEALIAEVPLPRLDPVTGAVFEAPARSG
jgi:uncharacterized protein YjlB